MKIEKFIRLKTIRKQSIIAFAIARQNMSIPRGKHTKLKAEPVRLELKNKFGSFFISSITETGYVDDIDIKNFISITDMFYDFFVTKSLFKKNKNSMKEKDFEIFDVSLQGGILFPITEIMRYRNVKKESQKAYKRIKESLEKFSIIRLDISEMSVERGKKRKKITKGWLNLFTTVGFVGKKEKMQECILVALHPFLFEAIRMGEFYPVDRKILNSLSGIAVNLYIMLEREHLKKVPYKHFSYKELIQESRFLFTKTGKKRPDRAKEKINKALNQMKRKKAIANWEEITMSRGEDGVKILWE